MTAPYGGSSQVQSCCQALGIQTSDVAHLPYHPETTDLVCIGQDPLGRMQRLIPEASQFHHQMLKAARTDGIHLSCLSGFRNVAYQYSIFKRKMERGLTLDAILRVNAPPGFSEHHSGRAVDLCLVQKPMLETSFEHTDAFAWLKTHAHTYGFYLSYPQNNPWGFIYEPWHWCWHPQT